MMQRKTTLQSALRNIEPLPAQSLVLLHHRISIVLYRKLVEGNFQLDEPSPTAPELSAAFGGSRVTHRARP